MQKQFLQRNFALGEKIFERRRDIWHSFRRFFIFHLTGFDRRTFFTFTLFFGRLFLVRNMSAPLRFLCSILFFCFLFFVFVNIIYLTWRACSLSLDIIYWQKQKTKNPRALAVTLGLGMLAFCRVVKTTLKVRWVCLYVHGFCT
jgi:hypothetical protein